jgi:hypothetical protein
MTAGTQVGSWSCSVAISLWADVTATLYQVLALDTVDCINKLTPRSRVLEKLIVTYLVKKFPNFYGTQNFHSVFTRARHWSLSWASCIQLTPFQPVSRWSIPVLFFQVFGEVSSLQIFDQNFVYISDLLHVCYMSRPSHPWLDHRNNIWWGV